jgi:predicted enzyme related to lactoylglutathione lyase
MTRKAKLTAVVLDCADPVSLADFYHHVTGWDVTSADAGYAALSGPVQLGFQRVEGYQGPAWPDRAKHTHFDFQVDDLELAEKDIIAIGATKPDFQPGEGEWTVLADPEGHLFCLVPAGQ